MPRASKSAYSEAVYLRFASSVNRRLRSMGPDVKGVKKHQEVQVISEVHIFNEVISDLDNDLYCLEGYVGYPQKSHEVLIEYGTDLVND